MTKAVEESAYVARKLGEIEAHEKNLSFLDRLRHVMGEEVYLALVRRLLASIPEPKTFAKDCEVIIIDDILIDKSCNKKLEEVVKDNVMEEGARNDCSASHEDEDLSDATSTMYMRKCYMVS
jgi:hypothetical protein